MGPTPRTLSISRVCFGLMLLPAAAGAQVHVQIGGAPPPPPPAVLVAPPPVQALPSLTPAPGGGAPVDLQMTANRPGIMLEQLRGTSAFVRSWQNRDGSTGSKVDQYQQWQPICQAPCGERIDSGGFYRIGGPGINRSRAFMLPANTPRVALTVRAGEAHRYRAGLALLVLGSAMTAVGLITVPIAEATASRSDPSARAFGEVLRYSAYPLLILGLGGLGGGIPLYLFNRTSVQLDGGMRLAKSGVYLTTSGLVF